MAMESVVRCKIGEGVDRMIVQGGGGQAAGSVAAMTRKNKHLQSKGVPVCSVWLLLPCC